MATQPATPPAKSDMTTYRVDLSAFWRCLWCVREAGVGGVAREAELQCGGGDDCVSVRCAEESTAVGVEGMAARDAAGWNYRHGGTELKTRRASSRGHNVQQLSGVSLSLSKISVANFVVIWRWPTDWPHLPVNRLRLNWVCTQEKRSYGFQIAASVCAAQNW